MTHIDFYLLPAGDGDDTVSIACRLCDKATTGGQRVYVHSPDSAMTEALDSALWTFRQGSFIAHERYTEAAHDSSDAAPPMVLIGALAPPPGYQDIMINLGPDTPQFFSQFERVLEVVGGAPPARASARKRFRFYKDRGYPLATHELEASRGRRGR